MEPGLDYDLFKDTSYSIVFIFENMGPDESTVSTVYVNIPKADEIILSTDTNNAVTIGASVLSVVSITMALLFWAD